MKLTCGSLVIVLSGCVASGSALAQTAPTPAPARPSPPRQPPAGRPPGADPRSEDARLRHRHERDRAARRRRAAARQDRELRPRPDASAGARDDRPGRRAARPRAHLHDGFERQQDLSGHRARRPARGPSSIRPTPPSASSRAARAKYARRVAVYIPKQYVPARRRRSSSAPTAPTRCSSPRSTT